MKLALFSYSLAPVFFFLSGCKPPKVDAVSPATPAAVAIPVEKPAALRVFLDDYCESVLAYDGSAAAVAWNNSKLAGMIFDIPSLSVGKKTRRSKFLRMRWRKRTAD